MALNIPNEFRGFQGIFEGLCRVNDAADVFDTLLEWIMWGFCSDSSLNWDCAKKYREEERKLFPELFKEIVLVMDKMVVSEDDWYDPFGTFYETYIAAKSRRDARGQFFTPSSVCTMMAKMNLPVGEKGNVGLNALVGDPTCGSGRTLLAFHSNKGAGNYLAVF